MSSPLPHPVVAISPTASAIVVVAVVVVVAVIILVVVVILIVTSVTTVFPPLFCDLFDCCVCSVVVSSPLPHPVVAIPPK